MRKWMRSRTREELWLCANGNTLGCAVIWRKELWYLTDCNVAAHSVDSDIFYVVINLSAGSKSYIITFTFSVKLWCVN